MGKIFCPDLNLTADVDDDGCGGVKMREGPAVAMVMMMMTMMLMVMVIYGDDDDDNDGWPLQHQL